MSIEQQLADILNSNSRLMERLNEAVAKCLESSQNALAAIQELTNHNNNGEAHPDIRALIADGVVSEAILNLSISDHDASENAHPALMTKIQSAIDDLTAVTSLVSESITEHNLSLTSHPDLRENINTIMDLLGGLDVKEINAELTTLSNLVNGEMSDKIIALQNVDARHDSLINSNLNRIVDLEDKCEEQQASSTILTNQQNTNTTAIDDLIRRFAPMEAYWQKQMADSSIDMSGFECTLAPYVGRNTVQQFVIRGAVGTTSGDNITYTIEEIDDNQVTISPVDNITDDMPLTMAVKPDNEVGSIITFTVTAHNDNTGGTSTRIISTMVTKPVSLENVYLREVSNTRATLSGFPVGVEPGREYNLQVVNLEDDGTDRYSYTVLSEAVSFAPSNLGQNNLNTVMSIPSDALRDTDFTVNLVVHDKYGADQEKVITGHVNPQPDLSGFIHTVPEVIAPTASYNIKFDGISSVNGNPATYAIENSNAVLSFSKTTNILANENVTLMASNAANRGQAYSFTVVATDENGAVSRVEVSTHINQLPTATSVLVHGLTATTFGGVTQTISFTGGNDEESNTNLKYVVDAGNSGLTFSRTNNIAANEEITVRVPKVASDSTKSFFIYTVDELGERSTTPKQVDMSVKAILVPDTPSITSPVNDSWNKWDFVMKWSPYTEHVDI